MIDIGLSSTTLRFSKSNEVATVSNFAISRSKIVNCQRSPSALVFFELKLHQDILEGDNLKKLTEELQQYVQDNPRIWDSMRYIRQEYIGGISKNPAVCGLDEGCHFVVFSLCFQHRLSWQSSTRIMSNRGELFGHINKLCKELGVKYDSPLPHQMNAKNTRGGKATAGSLPPSNTSSRSIDQVPHRFPPPFGPGQQSSIPF